jgi:hypothetical protein
MRSDEEQELIDLLVQMKGRPLTPQEERLSIHQARAIGYLPQDSDYDPRVMAPSWPRP